jgi:SAM-dependent methyltransferase
MTDDDTERRGDYEERGDYHWKLDPHWSYTPIYRRKLKVVDDFILDLPNQADVLDVGAGEGVLVNRYRSRGFGIVGVDANYQSELVKRADLLSLPFEDGHFDGVLCLDVLEHINLLDQPRAVKETYRVLKKDGLLLLSVPNLAHFHSRIKFLLSGKLTRTSAIERHPGDRPIREYIDILTKTGFRVIDRIGIFPTLPILFRLVNHHPARLGWLVAFLDRLLPLPGLCFLNVIRAKRL